MFKGVKASAPLAISAIALFAALGAGSAGPPV